MASKIVIGIKLLTARILPALFGLLICISPQTELCAEQPVEIKRLIIGLDLSKSNPLIANQAYASKLARRIGEEVRALRLEAFIHLRTFGVSDATRNTLRIDEQVTLRNSPDAIATGLETLIANVPQLVSSGKLEAQDETNIVGFIRTNINAIGECQTPTLFILLTDGLEDSEYGRLTGLGGTLSSPTIKPPKDKRYKCEQLILLGIGQGLESQSQIDQLKSTWSNWVGTKAPFKSFQALEDW